MTLKSKIIATISELMQILITRKHYQNTVCGEGTCASVGEESMLLHAHVNWRRMLGVLLSPPSPKAGSLTRTGASKPQVSLLPDRAENLGLCKATPGFSVDVRDLNSYV